MASTSGPTSAPTFGSKLRQLREAQNLTQEQLAERSGLTPHAISALERGDAAVRTRTPFMRLRLPSTWTMIRGRC